MHIVAGHSAPFEVLSNPDAMNIKGAFVKLSPFIAKEADLFSPGYVFVSTDINPLLMLKASSRFATPLKFSVLVPKSMPPDVLWFIVMFVADCLCVSFKFNIGLVNSLELMMSLTVKVHLFLAVALALSVTTTVML